MSAEFLLTRYEHGTGSGGARWELGGSKIAEVLLDLNIYEIVVEVVDRALREHLNVCDDCDCVGGSCITCGNDDHKNGFVIGRD